MATTSQGMFGGWSNWNFTPSAEAKKVFEESLGHLRGVRYYDLIACKDQLVNGKNYKFICAAKSATWPERTYLAEAVVYQPTEGKPHVKSIREIGPEPHPVYMGGYQNWHFPASPNAAHALMEATKHFMGSTFKSFGSTSQIVAGINYCLICEQTMTIPDAVPQASLVWVWQMTDHSFHITTIHHLD